MTEVIDRKDTTSMRTVDMNEKEDMSDQPPSASKLLQQHTQSSTSAVSVGERIIRRCLFHRSGLIHQE